MNRYLLAGAAAVALAVSANAAFAESKFEVRMGGDAVFEAAAVDQDRDTNRRSVMFADRVRLNTVATGTTDSGLKYGTRLRIRSVGGTGGSNTVDADKAYIFVEGAFGSVQMGTTATWDDDVISGMAGTAPLGWQTSVLNLVSEGALHSSGGNGTSITTALTANSLGDALGGKNASKIKYATPKFAGFQLGASYTPNNGSSGYTVVRADNTNNTYHDHWEIGLSYAGEFSGVGIKGIVDYQAGTRNDKGLAAAAQTEDLTAVVAGLQVSYAGFAIGGGYMNLGDSGQLKSTANKKDREIWTAGAQYTFGPGTIGGAYTHGKTTGLEQDVWAAGILYTVAPGLLMGAEYNYIDADATGTASDDKANVFMVRSVVLY